MPKKTDKTYIQMLKIIIERELRDKDVSELNLELCRAYARSISDYIKNEKEVGQKNPKLLLERKLYV